MSTGKITTTQNATINAPLAGTAGLTKLGNARLTLGGVNTYSGATTISAGTLALSSTGTIANSTNIVVGTTAGVGTLDLTAKGNFTFSSTQTLSGVGTVNISGGTVTIEGTHAVGNNSIGTQNVTGTISYASNSIFSWDVNASSYDKVTATSVAGGDAVFSINNLVSGGFGDSFWNTSKSWFDIFTGATDLAAIFGSFSGTGVSSSGLVANRGQFSFTGTTLNFIAIPEPSTALAGLLLSAGLLRRRRQA